MKRYKQTLLSLLLILLSTLSLHAQTSFSVRDRDDKYQYRITTTPSYCQNDGVIEVKIVNEISAPPLSQLAKVEYDVQDAQGRSYTEGYMMAPAPSAALRVPQLPGGAYTIFVRATPLSATATPIETKIQDAITIEDKYIPLEVVKEKVDKYRLPCRPEGAFHITVRGSSYGQPKLELTAVPASYTGSRTFDPIGTIAKGDSTIYEFGYQGNLPQGDYEYVLEDRCRRTMPRTFKVYGPAEDLPTVPSTLTVPFGIDVMSGATCTDRVVHAFGFSSDEKELQQLFETINKGYETADRTFPEYVDDPLAIIVANYEAVVVTQREYEQLQQGALDGNTLVWSDQRGSLTTVRYSGKQQGQVSRFNISYRLPQPLTLGELKAQKALPGALLLRVKRPNSGCNDYITIPIKVGLDFHVGTFQTLKTEQVDCTLGQIIWIRAWNFCSLQIKYYLLDAGESKPAAGASPVHSSKTFEPEGGAPILDKRYSFDGYDPTKRYYVELDVTDLYGNPVTPKPSMILEPNNDQKPIANRLYDFNEIYGRLDQPVVDRMASGLEYLGPVWHTYIATFGGQSLNALAGMEVTLVEAPDGYEDFQRTREAYYYKKLNPSNANSYGGGMIRLGETVKISKEFTGTGGSMLPDEFYPFSFLYKNGEHGERVVYPYNNGRELADVLPDIRVRNEDLERYMSQHPMPRGIYRFKFEHPCQPGDFFYLDFDINNSNFAPKITELLNPLVDYASCDEVRIYPFADGRLDYGVDEQGNPRNLAFEVTGLPDGKSKTFYFFPFNEVGWNKNPVDHTKFYIPIKHVDLPRNIKFSYRYLMPTYQWLIWSKPTATSVDPTGRDCFAEGEINRDSRFVSYRLPKLTEYNPDNDQEDWGQDGMRLGSGWKVMPYDPSVSVDVSLPKDAPNPSYLRYSYVGYRCSDETGYMEFKLINIPNKTGTVILRDPSTGEVVAQSDIQSLTDLVVRWNLNRASTAPLKDKYRLEISTTSCDDPGKQQTDFFDVELINVSQGVKITIYPQGPLCAGDLVTLTATDLGVPDENYKWIIRTREFDKNTGKFNVKTRSFRGRTIQHTVAAPDRVGQVRVEHDQYTLTVSGTKCGTSTTTGLLSISSDEMWWMPRYKLINREKGAYFDITVHTVNLKPYDPNGSIIVPAGTLAERETYDWNNPDNWVLLRDGKFYAANAVPAPCTRVHIVRIPYKDGNKLHAPAPDLSKEVTLRDEYGDPVCSEIIFHSGGEVYNIPLLTYERAMVRYNFGVDPTSPGYDATTHGTDGTKSQSDLRIYATQENFASDSRLYNRDKLYLMAAPLYDLYAGDYSFSASPYTYQLSFKAVPTGQGLVAGFDMNFSDPSPLQSVSLAQNNNSIALIVARDAQGFNLTNSSVIAQSRGILELPYFDRSDIASRFYHHKYDATTKVSRFQYFDGKSKRFRRYYSDAQRSDNAYRFIFEDPTTHAIPAVIAGRELYELEVDFGSPAQEIMVGNPFMSTIDLEDFLRVNQRCLEPYARTIEGTVTAYEPELKVDGQVQTFNRGVAEAPNRYVAPLQAFIIKPKSDAKQKEKLLFPLTIMPLGEQATLAGTLRSATSATVETEKAPLSYMILTMETPLGADRATVVFGGATPSVDKMLMSTESLYPSLSLIDPADRRYKDLYSDASAMGHYQLATHVAEPTDVTLRLTGSLLPSIVSARLLDHKSGLEYELTAGGAAQLRLYPDDREGRLELLVEGDFTAVAQMEAPEHELMAQYSAGRLIVRSAQPMETLRLVDGAGVTTYRQAIPVLTEYGEQLQLSSGSYVVEVSCTDGTLRRVMLVVP